MFSLSIYGNLLSNTNVGSAVVISVQVTKNKNAALQEEAKAFLHV